METTRWTVVIIQAQRGSPEARAALCNAYWYLVYAFFRRSGSAKEEALDLTQGLFVHLLETDIAGADRARGKFRPWLRAVARNYRASEGRRV
jgi:DNA-directed RNA polymerase specialized sigma24 family protein